MLVYFYYVRDTLRTAGAPDGYSEAWSKSTFEVKSIKELMKLTEEFEDDTED